MPRPQQLVEVFIYISTAIILLFLFTARPPAPFYALLALPVALAGVSREFVGGVIAALIALVSTALVIALDPDTLRRAQTLQAIWPVLAVYVGTGSLVGWFAMRQRQTLGERLGLPDIEEITRLYETERKWARALGAIGDACREIAAEINLDRTLRTVMAKAVETLPMDAGALFQFDLASQTFQVAANHNLSADHLDEITFGFDEGVPGWVVRQRTALIIPDAAVDNRVHPYVVKDGVLSLLAIPLEAREAVVGVLNLYSKTEYGAFGDNETRLAQVFADQAAIFIENARLFAELQEFTAELEARVERRTQALRVSQQQVIRSEKMAVVGRLAASVAHEVNNPLQAIGLHLELLAEDPIAAENTARINILRDELNRIAEIVRRLLDFQRPTTGQRQSVDVGQLLDDVLALADKQIQQRGVIVSRLVQTPAASLHLDGGQIKQVFLNLILNACDAMPEGGQLDIRTERHDGGLQVIFADTGQGIAAELMTHLFEPFFSTKTNGTGLGLAISHDIVAQHEGRLLVDSTPGVGTTFRVWLPMEHDE
jgi:signal transduction histidine kinase